jgi:hypothetical protein
MKKIILAIATACAFSLQAQTVFTPQTGDKELDNVLTEIDSKAKNDLNKFKGEVEQTFDLPKSKVDQMLAVMTPGDVYMAAQTAQVTNKPIDDVIKTHENNKEKGWGVTAKELGIKPGSKEFHALKGKVKDQGKKEKKEKKAKNKGKGKKDKKQDSTKTEDTKAKDSEKGKAKRNSKTSD